MTHNRWDNLPDEPLEWAPNVVPLTTTADADDAFEAQVTHHRAVTKETARLRVQREARRALDTEEADTITVPDPIRLDAFLAQPLDPITHRIDGLWPRAGRVLLSAQWKAGKTTLRDNVTRSLVDGEPFLGVHTVHPTNGQVTILDFELDPQTLQRWLDDQDYQNPHRVNVLSMKGRVAAFNIFDEALRARWAAALRGADTTILVVDCLRPILDALNLDESHDAGRFLNVLDALVLEAGINELFVVHHMGHGSERARGDSRLRDWPDAEWKLVRDKDDEDPTIDDPSGLRYFSAYGRDVDHPQVELTFDPDTRHLAIGEQAGNRKQAGERRKLQVAMDAVVEAIRVQPGINKRGLRAACKGSVARNEVVDAAVEALLSEGRVRLVRVGQTHLHHLVDLPPDASQTPTVPTVPDRAGAHRAQPCPVPIGHGHGYGPPTDPPPSEAGTGTVDQPDDHPHLDLTGLPGRCPTCEFHIPTQGHHRDCPDHPTERPAGPTW